MFIEIVKDILPILTILSHIAFALVLIALLVHFTLPGLKKYTDRVITFLRTYGLQLSFILALTSTLGSLFYSEIAGYIPCKLCWIQRIFMYPLVLILGIAVWKRDSHAKSYVVPMCVLGGLFAGYHTLTQFKAVSSVCSIEAGADCAARLIFDYGYVSIPVMALTAFVLIGLLSGWNSSN